MSRIRKVSSADTGLRVLANAIALALTDEPAKRDVILEMLGEIRSDLGLPSWTSPHVLASRHRNIAKPVITIDRDDREGA